HFEFFYTASRMVEFDMCVLYPNVDYQEAILVGSFPHFPPPLFPPFSQIGAYDHGSKPPGVSCTLNLGSCTLTGNIFKETICWKEGIKTFLLKKRLQFPATPKQVYL
ncbi:MAG: hypothetical protein MI920_38820, partial [Kiloniellales bacterium]|nr:hypothetical protein [Kiloniellales bacterium]